MKFFFRGVLVFLIILLISLSGVSAKAEGIRWIDRETTQLLPIIQISDNLLTHGNISGQLVCRYADNGQEILRFTPKKRPVWHTLFRNAFFWLDETGLIHQRLLTTESVQLLPLPPLVPSILPVLAGQDLYGVSQSSEVLVVDLATARIIRKIPVNTTNVSSIVPMSKGRCALLSKTSMMIVGADGQVQKMVQGKLLALNHQVFLWQNLGETSMVLYPEEVSLDFDKKGETLGVTSLNGQSAVFSGKQLALLQNNTWKKINFSEEIRAVTFVGGAPVVLLMDRRVVFLDHITHNPIRELEFGSELCSLQFHEKDLLLFGKHQLICWSKKGVRTPRPWEVTEDTSSVFGVMSRIFRSEKYRFDALTWSESQKCLYLIGRRGEGQQNLLEFTDFGTPIKEIQKLNNGSYDKIFSAEKSLCLVKLGETGQIARYDHQSGSFGVVFAGPVYNFALLQGKNCFVGKNRAQIQISGLEFPVQLTGEIKTLTTSGSLQSEVLLAMSVSGAHKTITYLSPMGEILDFFELPDWTSLICGSPGERAVLYSAGNSNILAYRRKGMRGTRQIVEFSAEQYKLETIIADQQGLFSVFHLDMKEKTTGLTGLFSPRGFLVKNIGLESGFRGFCFGERSTRLFAIGQEENMGVLKLYFLDNEPD